MVITLSRQAECGGEDIARVAAERGGLRIADRAILERIAEREGRPIADLAVFDEVLPDAIQAIISEWRSSVSQQSYLRRLSHVLLLLEREDNIIIIGRGAAFILADPGTLHVRVVAPMPCRVARLMQRAGVSPSQAQRMLAQSDDARARFVRAAFDADIAEPTHYDLTINTAEMTIEEAADLILLGARQKAVRRAIGREAPEDFLSQMLRSGRRPRLPRVRQVVWEYHRRSSW